MLKKQQQKKKTTRGRSEEFSAANSPSVNTAQLPSKGAIRGKLDFNLYFSFIYLFLNVRGGVINCDAVSLRHFRGNDKEDEPRGL